MFCNKIKYTNNLKILFAFSELFCSADDTLYGDSLFVEAGSPNTSTVARAKQTRPTRPKCPQRNSPIWLNNFRCTVPKEIYFPRYNMKCSGENVILRGIVHVVSCFPLHFMLYHGNLDYFSDSVYLILLLK